MTGAAAEARPARAGPLIIGLTGPVAAGKTEVAQILCGLANLGYLSLASYVREEARSRGLEPTREVLQEVGNQVRRDRGPGCFAARALEDIALQPQLEGFVVDGLRHPEEAEVLRRGGRFRLLAVDAPVEVRFRRNVGRGYLRQAVRERFLEDDAREMGAGQPPWGMQVRHCMDLARPPFGLVIDNVGSLEALGCKVRQAWEALRRAGAEEESGAPAPNGPSLPG
ncbi:MAG: AAA family ATPase [Acetobacteraceae bacterium]|nr:AAA family ATPase [Acetobacteraceae bacterium]